MKTFFRVHKHTSFNLQLAFLLNFYGIIRIYYTFIFEHRPIKNHFIILIRIKMELIFIFVIGSSEYANVIFISRSA